MDKRCSHGDCQRVALAAGLCGAHYQRKRVGIDMSRPITQYRTAGRTGGPCGVQGCERVVMARDLCRLHYSRMRKSGDPLVLKRREPVRRELPNETSPTKLAKLLGVSRQRAHQLLNMTAHRARLAVQQAVQNGRLVKPDNCERCGKHHPRLEAHHWDYREELDVRWLCPPCHSVIHPHDPAVHGKINQQVVPIT